MQTDATHSSSLYDLWAWFEKNKKPVLMGAAGAVLVAFIVCFLALQQEEKQKAAGQELAGIWMQSSGAMSPPGMAQAYLKLATTHSGSQVGAQAVLLAASTLFAEGKYDEAKAQFQRFIRDYGTAAFANEAYLGLAACLDAQGKTNDAMTSYKDVIDHHPGEAVVPQAKFALARLYLAQNKLDQALNYYQEVARAIPYSTLGQEAAMHASELQIDYPALAPKTVSPSSPVMNLPNK